MGRFYEAIKLILDVVAFFTGTYFHEPIIRRMRAFPQYRASWVSNSWLVALPDIEASFRLPHLSASLANPDCGLVVGHKFDEFSPTEYWPPPIFVDIFGKYIAWWVVGHLKQER
jgi:hypothetical protein